MNHFKNRQSGIAHWIVPALVVSLVAVIGTVTMTASNAATLDSSKLTINSPVASATVADYEYVVATVATGREVQSVAFQANGQPIKDAGASNCFAGKPQPTPAPRSYAVCWNSKAITNGSYAVTAQATYKNGKTSQLSPAVSVNVKHSDPAIQKVTILQPSASAAVQGYVPLYVKTAVAATKVDFYVNSIKVISDPPRCSVSTTTTQSPMPNTFSGCWNTNKSESLNGSFKLVAVAYDANGAPTSSAPILVTAAKPL